MDLVTQGILGASVGLASGYRVLGRKAAFWGAIVALIPDADVIWCGHFFDTMIHHRGFTHSLWFGPVFGTLLAYLMCALYEKNHEKFSTYASVFILALVTHPVLDVFTPYGTQLLAPFSNMRFALNGVAIIDPFYSLPLLLCVVLGLIKMKWNGLIQGIGLTLTTMYLFYGVGLKDQAIRDVRNYYVSKSTYPVRIEAYPTLFQPFLKRILVFEPHQVHVGWYSLYGKSMGFKHNDTFISFPTHALPFDLAVLSRVKTFVWFSDEAFLVEKNQKSYDVYDLRFGMPWGFEKGIWGIRIDDKKNVSSFKNTPKIKPSLKKIKEIYAMAFPHKND
jgi:inner membrane protein